MYGVQDDLAAKIRALQEENLTLRNKVLSSNEQIFELQASIMTCDAEAKFYVETELKKIQSETNFRNKEFANLNREHQAVLKELAQAKQALKTSNSTMSNVNASTNVITPSQLAGRNAPGLAAASAEENTLNRVCSTTSSDCGVEAGVAREVIASCSKPNKENGERKNMNAYLLSQYHALLMSLSLVDWTCSPLVILSTNNDTESVSGVEETPQTSKKVGSIKTGTGVSGRPSPTSLSKIKGAAQRVSSSDALQQSWKEVQESASLLSTSFYEIHVQTSGSDLSMVLGHLLSLCRALLSVALTKRAVIAPETLPSVDNELTSIQLCLSLSFSVVSFLDRSVVCDNFSRSAAPEVSVVGNLSKKFEQVAAASLLPVERRAQLHASPTKGVKRKIEDVTEENTENSTCNANAILRSVKLPSLGKSEWEKLSSSIQDRGRESNECASSVKKVGFNWTLDFCTLCSDIVSLCDSVANNTAAAVVKTLTLVALVLFHRHGVNPIECLPCLTVGVLPPSLTKSHGFPAVLTILLMKSVPLETKSQLVSVLSVVLTDRRVFQEMVTDEEHRMAATVSTAAILTSTGSESGRSTALTAATSTNNNNTKEVDEEERMPTTSTDGGELLPKTGGGCGGAGDKKFLHVLIGLLVNSTLSKDGLILRNRIVILLQDLLFCHGCQFISWLVGRSAEDVLNSAGEARPHASRLSESMDTSAAANRYAGPASVLGSSSSRTPAKRGNGSTEASDLLTPLPSSAVTPGSAGSSVSNVKLPTDFQSFVENDGSIDRVGINRLVDALKTSIRLLDTLRPTCCGDTSGEQKLHCLLVHRLVNLFNGIAGRMTPNDWSILILERNDFINAFLNRSYVNRLHPDIIIRSEQIEYLDRECE